MEDGTSKNIPRANSKKDQPPIHCSLITVSMVAGWVSWDCEMDPLVILFGVLLSLYLIYSVIQILAVLLLLCMACIHRSCCSYLKWTDYSGIKHWQHEYNN